jgi:hypothetical protein
MWLAGFVACTAFGAGGFGAGGFGAGGLSHHCFLNAAGAYRKGCHTVSTGISCGRLERTTRLRGPRCSDAAEECKKGGKKRDALGVEIFGKGSLLRNETTVPYEGVCSTQQQRVFFLRDTR